MVNIVKEPLLVDLHYLPSVSWFRMVNEYNRILLDKHEHYVKGSYRNRCHIQGPNGLLRLSIPLMHGKHQHKKSGEVLISNEHNWQKIHWMTICSCYRRSAYFEFFEDTFYPFYHQRFELLFDFNHQLLSAVCRILQLKIEVQTTDSYIPPGTEGITDKRSAILPGETNDYSNKDQPYIQVFSDRFEFMPDLSIIDFIFNNANKMNL